jgi:hypothetical protein
MKDFLIILFLKSIVLKLARQDIGTKEASYLIYKSCRKSFIRSNVYLQHKNSSDCNVDRKVVSAKVCRFLRILLQCSCLSCYMCMHLESNKGKKYIYKTAWKRKGVTLLNIYIYIYIDFYITFYPSSSSSLKTNRHNLFFRFFHGFLMYFFGLLVYLSM